jgi:hypothetical protein
MTTLAIERRADLWRFALGSIGVAIFLFQTIVFADRWWIPGGDIRDIYIPAGEAVRAGVTPYVLVGNPIPFFYAPPIAVVFAALSFLPLPMVWALVVIAEFAALRYIARSWWLFGLLLAFPLMPFEIWGGTLNLIVAAAIVAAVRGDAWLVIAGSLMKIAPILAADPREWRRYVLPGAAALAITVPWLWLWPAYIEHMLAAIQDTPRGPVIGIPFPVRLVVGLALIATRKPWARALGATLALPAFYWGSLVVLVAPVAVLLTSARARQARR